MDTKEPTRAPVDRDEADLAQFGYKQELKRTLGVFSSFAVAFSYISPSTGIFTLFYLALTIGGAMFWTWPIVAAGQLLVALNFAELSSHYPIAGSVFQWTKYLSGRTYAWFTGWIYLFAGIITVAAVCATLPIALIPAINSMFGANLNNTLGSTDQLIVAVITLAVITVLNIYGVRLVSIINNTGVVFEILGMVIFAFIMALFHNHQGIGVIFHTQGQSLTFSTFLTAMFMSLFVIYGFDTASTLSEETKDPRREAPKAVIGSIVGALIIGGIFLWGTLMAVPNMPKAAASLATGPQTIIEANFSSAIATVYLLIVSAAIFVCCMSIMTSTVRLCFGMSRDDQLPLSKALARVSPRLHTPIWSCVAVAVLSAVPFLQFAGATVVAVSATAMIYLSYFLGNLAIMRARLKGWPRVKAPFSLGRWGKPINVLALCWGGLMLINFLWYSNSKAFDLRQLTNPKATQTDYFGTGPLVHFVGFLNKIPLIELIMVVVIVVGAVYYYAVQRNKPFTPVVPPEEGALGTPAQAVG
jgi:urea carboxylase system permease